MMRFRFKSAAWHYAVFTAVGALLLWSLHLPPRAQAAPGPPPDGGREARVSAVRSTLQARIADGHWTYGQGAAACGIYAACRSLDLLGVDADPGRFFTLDYLANSEGSTPGKIVKIIESLKFQAVPMVNLTKLDLMATGYPVVANVRSPGTSLFNHWVCVVFANGRLMVFDGSAQPVEVSFADFLPLWNGYGVVVSPPDQPVVSALWSLRVVSVLGFLLVGLSCALLMSKLHCARIPAAIRMATVCVALSVAGNFVFGDLPHLAAGIRLASSSSPTKFTGREFDQITENDEKNYILIDARYRDTYEKGSIDQSINIPVDASEIALRGLFEGIDRDVPLLVYCHSSTCPYDTTIAGKLSWLGFRDVNVSNMGWVEYSAARKDAPKVGTPDTKP